MGMALWRYILGDYRHHRQRLRAGGEFEVVLPFRQPSSTTSFRAMVKQSGAGKFGSYLHEPRLPIL